jgi:curved DNA-binding protein CbpA
MDEFRDYYRVLRIRSTADDAAIKSAFRRLALRYHPDRAGNDKSSRRFRDIREAYEVLSDPDKRRRYDAAYRARRAALRPVERIQIVGPRRIRSRGLGLTLDVLGLRVDIAFEAAHIAPTRRSSRRRRPAQPKER